MTRFYLRLLGGFSLVKDKEELSGRATRKVEALLSVLAVAGSPQSRSTLAGRLWRDMPEKQAKVNLRRALSNLRSVVGELVQSNKQEVWLRTDWYDLDVAKFSHSTEPENLAAMQSRIDLYQGDFLEGFVVRNAPAFEEWVLRQQVRLRENAIELLYRIVAGQRRAGDLSAAIVAARRLLEIDCWREEGHRQLMLLLAEDGQRAAGLAQYEKCRHLLLEEFGVDPSSETEDLCHKIKQGEVAVQPKAAPTVIDIPHNLPASRTPFIGRLQEIANINDLLANPGQRLVSLVAAGGMGKTRLALAIAQGQLEEGHYPHGIFFIALAPLSSADSVVPVLAHVINFPLQNSDGRSPRQQILDYLRAKKMLLIFDNFEHQLDARDLLADILQSAPDVKMLITSRERLNLYGEQLYTLRGLSLAETDIGMDWTRKEAVQLFLQSAKREQANYVLREDERLHLLALCKQVDGIPLALELAAGWVNTLTVEEISTELAKSLDILATEMEGMPRRQRSMRAVWQSSWSRLTTTEQAIFCQLSIFKGGFTLEAISRVVNTNPRQIQKLVNKCLLQFEPRSKRYQIHELLRQLGFEKLAENPGKLQLAQQQHMAYYFDKIVSWEGQIQRPNQIVAVAEFKADFDNVLLAIRNASCSQQYDALAEMIPSFIWLVQFLSQRTGEATQTLLDLSLDLADKTEDRYSLLRLYILVAILLDWGLWKLAAPETRDIYTTVQRLFTRYLAQPELFEAHTVLFYHFSQVEYAFDERAKALTLAELALKMLRREESPFFIGRVLQHLGALDLAFTGEYERATQLLQESLKIQNVVGDAFGKARTLFQLSYLARLQSRLEDSRYYAQQLLELSVQLGDMDLMANAQLNMGLTQWVGGKPRLALNNLKHCLETLSQLGNEAGLAASLSYWSLSAAAIDVGNYAEGRIFAQRNIEAYHSPLITSNSLDSLARIDLVENHKQRALLRSKEALTIRREVIQIDRLMHNLGLLALIHASLGDIAAAKNALQEFFPLCLKTRSYEITFALTAMSLLKLGEGDSHEAIRFYAMACQYPFVVGSQWFADVAGKPIEAEAKKLPQISVQSAKKQGRQANVWTTAELLIAELKNGKL